MTSQRNTPPQDIWDVLRRLYQCNRSQLADRLGVDRRTLYRWQNGEATAETFSRAADALRTGLMLAEGADALAQWPVNAATLDYMKDRANEKITAD